MSEQIKTKRLVMKTNINIDEYGEFNYPNDNEQSINILSLKPKSAEDTGFVFCLSSDEKEIVCHIGFRNDRKPMEITYGTEEKYQGQGYMTEALNAFLKWFFENTEYKLINGLIPDSNTKSRSVAEKNGFVFSEKADNNVSWYKLEKVI
ncbi:MAG: GNAT family N-acetyltransferase [Eubacterium sp.]|nr:GNAT family N-acetyltransferase [Eubacterium sp.]